MVEVDEERSEVRRLERWTIPELEMRIVDPTPGVLCKSVILKLVAWDGVWKSVILWGLYLPESAGNDLNGEKITPTPGCFSRRVRNEKKLLGLGRF